MNVYVYCTYISIQYVCNREENKKFNKKLTFLQFPIPEIL